MKIILARHGETPWNAAGRYQGQIDIPLSETGEAQARKLGERLLGVDITRAVQPAGCFDHLPSSTSLSPSPPPDATARN